MGAPLVAAGATIMCTFGAAPGTLNVTPDGKVTGGGAPAATIMDNVMGKNITPFGVCMSMANPAVASATAAALGVLTPQPCTPNVPAPWVPGSPTVMVAGKPALNANCKAICAFGGTISVVAPGQFTVMVP